MATEHLFDSQPAGFGARLRAHMLDTLIVWVPLAIVEVLLLSVLPTESGLDLTTSEAQVPATRSWSVSLAIVGALWVFALIFYYGRPIGRTGQTFGKRACGVQVVDAATGQTVGTRRAIVRQLAPIFSFPLYVLLFWIGAGGLLAAALLVALCHPGFLWMLWDPRKQTWHDKIAGTVVVRAPVPLRTARFGRAD